MEALLDLTAHLPERAMEEGEALIVEGEPASHIYVLVEGALMVRKGGDDFYLVDEPGACVGEISALLGRPHTAEVVTLEPSRIRVIEDARATLETSPATLLAVATLLASRLDLVNRYLADVQHQYRDVEGGLGILSDVMQHLASHHGDRFETGSDREPDGALLTERC